MSINFTDFNFSDLVVLITTINIIINFFTLLLYEEFKSLKRMGKEKKNESRRF